VDGAAVEGGRGRGADMARLALQCDWGKRWFQGGGWHVGGYWDAALGRWWTDAAPGQNRVLTELGLTPVFRLQHDGLEGLYLEAAIGIHLLSQTSIGDRRFSTTFQFGDHIGGGYRFGARRAFEIGYRFQHISNADINTPNRGMDFHQLRLQYHF
jgi:lipid A 3-O-deacylase